MAPQSSVPLLRALPALLLAAALRGCSGAPAGGRALQTVVGPDGTLTQAGRAGAAGGAGQPPAYGPTRPTAYAAPAYAGGSPAYASRGAPPGYSVPVASAAPASSAPVYSAAASAGPPCLVPMWDEESYVCKYRMLRCTGAAKFVEDTAMRDPGAALRHLCDGVALDTSEVRKYEEAFAHCQWEPAGNSRCKGGMCEECEELK
ncbi:unnamed protein product [Prorocentrum cordatum]|uniref:Uncharacterized protein n=2 Tax=Prorocentrum cordatum TaxID=2364126 RepID=A0ABN9W3Z0_9DINO|nr:unnamed protein product [Polarella glacialis]